MLVFAEQPLRLISESPRRKESYPANEPVVLCAFVVRISVSDDDMRDAEGTKQQHLRREVRALNRTD